MVTGTVVAKVYITVVSAPYCGSPWAHTAPLLTISLSLLGIKTVVTSYHKGKWPPGHKFNYHLHRFGLDNACSPNKAIT